MSATRVDSSTDRYASELDPANDVDEEQDDEDSLGEGSDSGEVTRQTAYGRYVYRTRPQNSRANSGGSGKKGLRGLSSLRSRLCAEEDAVEADDAVTPNSPSIARKQVREKHEDGGSGQHGNSDGQSRRGNGLANPRLSSLDVKAGSPVAPIDPALAPFLAPLRDAVASADPQSGPSTETLIRCMVAMYDYLRTHPTINARAAFQQFHLVARAARNEHVPTRRGAGLDEIEEAMARLPTIPHLEGSDPLPELEKTLNLLAALLMLSSLGPQSRDHKRMLEPRTRAIAMHANKVA
ncbi:hypothetical protein LJR230_002188 [Trinickia sp. LjRoot230]|uniref:hypothetical protein n=1 Tax=Trinickia sp. LjRoot230 TaxID=3342288 RepID=UPI003ECD9972